MNKWLTRIRGALGMGVTWAFGWAVTGILIGVMSKLLPGLPFWDSFFRVFDAPLPAMAVPGFFAGAFFSIVVGIAGRDRKFHELSIPRFAAWGALGGVMLTLFPSFIVLVGLASINPPATHWGIIAVAGPPLVLLSTLSAIGTLLLARRAEKGARLASVPDARREEIGEGAEQERGRDQRVADKEAV